MYDRIAVIVPASTIGPFICQMVIYSTFIFQFKSIFKKERLPIDNLSLNLS